MKQKIFSHIHHYTINKHIYKYQNVLLQKSVNHLDCFIVRYVKMRYFYCFSIIFSDSSLKFFKQICSVVAGLAQDRHI